MSLIARPLLGLFVAGLAMLSAAGTATSADLGAPGTVGAAAVAPANQWQLSFTPYAWAPFLDGDVTVKGRTVGIDINPIQLLEDLERVPWMSYAEARKGPLALYNDIFYANLGVTGSGVRSRRVAPQIGGTLGASLGLDFEEAVIELGGAYEIARWSSAGSLQSPSATGSYTAIDVLGGARYWYQQMDINLAVTAGVVVGDLVVSGNRAIARSGSVDWVDPVVGGRIRHQLAPGQELMLRGDVGGFDVGSQFSWNALAAYSWDFAVRDGVTYSGVLGYRALYVDYEQGSGRNKYEYDMLQHGPLTGLTIRF